MQINPVFITGFPRFLPVLPCLALQCFNAYCKVANSRPVYYSNLNPLGQRSQYINITILKMLGCATNQNSLLLVTLQYFFCYIDDNFVLWVIQSGNHSSEKKMSFSLYSFYFCQQSSRMFGFDSEKKNFSRITKHIEKLLVNHY